MKSFKMENIEKRPFKKLEPNIKHSSRGNSQKSNQSKIKTMNKWKLDYPVLTHNEGHFECYNYLDSLIDRYGEPLLVFNYSDSLTIVYPSKTHSYFIDNDGGLHKVVSNRMYRSQNK